MKILFPVRKQCICSANFDNVHGWSMSNCPSKQTFFLLHPTMCLRTDLHKLGFFVLYFLICWAVFEFKDRREKFRVFTAVFRVFTPFSAVGWLTHSVPWPIPQFLLDGDFLQLEISEDSSKHVYPLSFQAYRWWQLSTFVSLWAFYQSLLLFFQPGHMTVKNWFLQLFSITPYDITTSFPCWFHAW